MMGWLSSTWRRRAAITVYQDTADTTPDAEIVIPMQWDEFWEAIDTAGFELRIVDCDGVTLLNYSLSGWNKATRTGTIQIDELPSGDGSITPFAQLVWIYFDSATNQGDGSVATTIVAPISGSIELSRPSHYQLSVSRERVGATEPRHTFAKAEDDQVFVWLNLTGVLEERREAQGSRRIYEEPCEVVSSIQDSAGSPVPAMLDESMTRFVELPNRGRQGRQMWVRGFIKGGTSGTPVTLVEIVRTIAPDDTISGPHRQLDIRAGIEVQNTLQGA
jgi:hypothetical protein